MVISDGNLQGRRSSRENLHRAVAQMQAMRGMTLVGLRLGPSTEHVTSYYPVSQANIALGDPYKGETGTVPQPSLHEHHDGQRGPAGSPSGQYTLPTVDQPGVG